MENSETEQKVVAVSGGFDPIHIGHVQMFQNAKRLGDKLIVILNNDNWLRAKKGFAFMPEDERKYIIEALGCVDEVVITDHEKNPNDMSVANTLRKVKPHVFANGGDRKEGNTPEGTVCSEISCEMIYNIGGDKIQSSSWLLDKYKKVCDNLDLLKSKEQKRG